MALSLIRKFSLPEISLLPETFLFLFISRLKVSYLPARKWMPQVAEGTAVRLSSTEKKNSRSIVKVIELLEHRTFWKNSCLIKSLTAHYMLKRRQIGHNLHIGVAQRHPDQLRAHAWISIENIIILGGGKLEGFHEISKFN